jgi:hypothetical protein
MTQDEFARAVAADLKVRGAPYDRDQLWKFLEDVRPLVEPGDAPRLWADA